MFGDDCEEDFQDEHLLVQDPRACFSKSIGADSLMNMSFMTLDETRIGSDETSPTNEAGPRRSILVKRDTSVPKRINGRPSRVSFLGKSLMAIDDLSFSNLVETISEPVADLDIGDSGCSQPSIS